MNKPQPRRVSLESVPVRSAGDDSPGISFARILTKAEHGTAVLTGALWVEPGAEHSGWRFDAEQEVYFGIRGRIELSWEEGSLTFGPNDAVLLPAGWFYRFRNVGDEPAFFVYSMYPPPE